MKRLRILLVANGDRHRLQGQWNNTEHKLWNGLTREGHMVVFYSDRDRARELTALPSKRFGVTKMNAELVETARHFKPDLILFGHADLCKKDDFVRLRETVDGVRLAQFNVDSVFREKTMHDFSVRSQEMDASFITSADGQNISGYGVKANTVFFMPNPVDQSIETARVFEASAQQLGWDGQFLGTGIERRGEQLDYLTDHLPKEYRFNIGGRAKGDAPLVSVAFYDALAQAASCPILPLDDTRPDAYLYASNRVAQTLGQGVLSFCMRSSNLSTLYEDGIVEWDSREELVEAMVRYQRDDDERRRVAEIGWRIGHERFSVQIVARAMLQTIMGWDLDNYFWPTEAFA